MRPPHLPERLQQRSAASPGWDLLHEDGAVRQYRYLLRTAAPDAVESAHMEALLLLGRTGREAVLRALRDGLMTGLRLTPEDVVHLAHLLTVGERRAPGSFLSSCDPAVLHDLAERVIVAEAAVGLWGRYSTWDGTEPKPANARSGQRVRS